MTAESTLLKLLHQPWGELQEPVSAFLESPYAAMLEDALRSLKRDALYMSHVHGIGHIERTMLHGAMCAWAEALNEADSRLLLLMCSYHDTGRNCDFLDGAHGKRSAEKLPGLVQLSEEALREAQAGIEAHSVGDSFLEPILEKYAPENRERALMLSQMLKDADGLDRVRIRDLDPKFLRRKHSAERAVFAQALFDRYDALEQAENLRTGLEGFDLPTIQKTKAFVSECYDSGMSCAEAAACTLRHLTDETCAVSEISVPEGECGLLSGALAFFRAWLPVQGYDSGETEAKLSAFRQRFRTQYGSTACKDIRLHVSCRGFTVDAVLFAVLFLEEIKK